jgi:hypothetical protein
LRLTALSGDIAFGDWLAELVELMTVVAGLEK